MVPNPVILSLTDAEARELEHLVRAHTTAQALALRARIILQAHAKSEQSNQQLASAPGTTDRTVRKWRGRWVKTHQLADAPRSGTPRRFSLKCARKSPPSRVACPSRNRFRSRVAAGLNWLDV